MISGTLNNFVSFVKKNFSDLSDLVKKQVSNGNNMKNATEELN
jgi:hypothetical protein